MKVHRGSLALFAMFLVGSCVPHETRRIGATDTLANIPAIQDAARDRDRRAIPALIVELDSDDPAVRFYAINSLQKLTNQTFGYHYYDGADGRRPAVQRWKNWLATQPPLTPK